MNRQKSEKKKKPAVIAVVILLVLAGIYALLKASTVIETESDPLIYLYGEDHEAGMCSASLFHKKLDHVSESDNINWDKTGTYQVTYKAYLGPLPLKAKTVEAEVIDVDAPQLTLTSGSIAYVDTGDSSYMPSYTVSDNYDKPSDISVTLKGSADFNKPGIYHEMVQACDTSDNCTSRSLILNVGDAKPDFTPGTFHLSDYDPDGTVLYTPRDKQILTDEEFDEIWWAGDSNYVNMGKYGGLNPKRVISRMALAPSAWNLPVYYDNEQTDQTIDDYVKEYRPECIIIGMGLAEVSDNAEKFADAYGRCIDDLKSIDPDMKIIISAIMPIRKGKTGVGCSQAQINQCNYELLRMAEKKHVRMIDSSTWLADKETGYGQDQIYLDDGYHLVGSCYSTFTDFVKYTVNLKEYDK